MRTNIEIDDKLIKEAMKASGTTTKRAVVEAALSQMVRIHRQGAIRKLRGRVVWRSQDDDWFASDEEIKTRRQTAKAEPRMQEKKPSESIRPSAMGRREGHR
jgi:Arc/MetJ family transcription regulator